MGVLGNLMLRDESTEMEERRGFDRRIEMLERQTNKLEMRVTLCETKIDGLVETIKSRFTAMDRGHDLILTRLDALVPASALSHWMEDQRALQARTKVLEDAKSQIDGAFFLIKLLGVAGIIGGVIAIIRLIKGGP